MALRGSDVRRLRERNGWSQSDLAAAINVALERSTGSGQISTWENGKRKIPDEVDAFLSSLIVETGLPASGDDGDDDPVSSGSAHDVAGDTSPDGGPDAAAAAASSPQPPLVSGSSSYGRACAELWEMIGAGVGMVGAATGSQALMTDGAIIVADKEALGQAWGRLAEQNDTFRRMLIGMTEGGAWLQVALVTGTTVSKCYQAHAQLALERAALAEQNGALREAEPEPEPDAGAYSIR